MSETRKHKMESDFNPAYVPENMPGFDTRIINAVEYSAYQLGQINRTLTRLVDILEKHNGPAASELVSAAGPRFQAQ